MNSIDLELMFLLSQIYRLLNLILIFFISILIIALLAHFDLIVKEFAGFMYLFSIHMINKLS
jgi:hypothetical protein